MASPIQITSLIVEQLSGGEMRVLRLVVAVRSALGRSGNRTAGDLSVLVKTALRKLVAAEAVVDADGTYSLSAPR
jgi:hypothetical protein